MCTMTDSERLPLLARLNEAFMSHVPHNKALGIVLITMAEGEAVMRLPYRADLIGNPETGVLHGGAITSMMDACCGAAVFMALEQPTPIATLDLRIDYLRPAEPPQDVVAKATCYKTTRNVAFVRCLAYHGEAHDDPIATATGTFMLSSSPRTPPSEAS